MSGFPGVRRRSAAVCLIAALGLLTTAATAEDRTYDGTDNNATHADWGKVGSQLRRVSTVGYADGVASPAGPTRPNPRAISNAVLAQAGVMPNARNCSDYIWAWGQFLAHEVELLREAEPIEALNITVPPGDTVFTPGSTIPLNRNAYDTSTGGGAGNPRQQRTFTTAWIDGSAVYGSDKDRADWLRTGVGGRMKTSAGNLLPFNDALDPLENLGGDGTDLFVAGDIRANEQPALLAMHTLFVREHNRLADGIAAGGGGLDDEQIYQRARRLVGAEIQAVTFNQFLPALLGPGAVPAYSGYKDGVNPSPRNVFSAAAYRVGHTTLSSQIMRMGSDWQPTPEGHLTLRDTFFRPELLTDEGGVEPIFRGLLCQRHQEIDTFVIDDVRNFLVIPGIGGLDLTALNMQRGRDHGLPDYNTLRADFGLPAVPLADLPAAMQTVYGDAGQIDPWLGMLAEPHAAGAGVGELMRTIIGRQFEDIRDGDRFWYAIDPELTPADVQWLNQLSLREIIELNCDVEGLPQNVFFAVPEPASALLLCLGGPLAFRRRRR